jgi:AAA15 family ATPase/GTPase
MIIKFEGVYRSLRTFTSEELGGFAVITGKNGSGKSQLVELLGFAGAANDPFAINLEPNIPRHLRQVEGLEFKSAQQVKGTEIWSRQANELFSAYSQYSIEKKECFEELFNNGLDPIQISDGFDFTDYVKTSNEEEKEQSVWDYAKKLMSSHYMRPGDTVNDVKRNISNMFFNMKPFLHSVNIVATFNKKKFSQLDRDDFLVTPLEEVGYNTQSASPFSIQIENIFYSYARKRFANEIAFNKRVNYNVGNESLPPIEFIKKFPAPWVQLNDILKEHNIKYRIPEIKPESFSPEMVYNFFLVNIFNNQNVKFEELSLGEKVIIGLIIRLFLSQRYKERLQFPECVVLDEPDAFLHPEMSYLLLDVLYKTFYKQFGIKVILTTHSASTVALAPEDCLFEMLNEPKTSLKKIDKEKALKVLTENIPLLSINYSNHRQIFVESPTDQFYYQNIFSKLKKEKPTLYDLYFITTGYGKSNCESVKSLTKELRKAGNKTSYGIIDWDKTNSSEEFILVNGENKRYSIENFIFDPLHLCALFIEQDCANNISVLGFSGTYNQYSLGDESEVRLQQIVDWFFEKMATSFPNLKNLELEKIEYLNGKKVEIPKWYLTDKGHDIEVRLKKAFRSLDAFKNEGELQKSLTEICIKCYPLVPKEPYELLKQLSNN